MIVRSLTSCGATRSLVATLYACVSTLCMELSNATGHGNGCLLSEAFVNNLAPCLLLTTLRLTLGLKTGFGNVLVPIQQKWASIYVDQVGIIIRIS